MSHAPPYGYWRNDIFNYLTNSHLNLRPALKGFDLRHISNSSQALLLFQKPETSIILSHPLLVAVLLIKSQYTVLSSLPSIASLIITKEDRFRS
jgi:hypothetical protein